jgi:hypothetical protein
VIVGFPHDGSDEVLVADLRGTLTPAQMVEEKLLALLGSCSRSQGDSRIQFRVPVRCEFGVLLEESREERLEQCN